MSVSTRKPERRKPINPKSLDEFKKLIAVGCMFAVSGMDGVYAVDKVGGKFEIEDIACAPNPPHGVFKTVQDMLDGFVIENKPLRDYWNKASVRPF